SIEYLLIHHLLGNKTLLEGVKQLPPGCKLEYKKSKWKIIQYTQPTNVRVNNNISLEKACKCVWNYLNEKFDSYQSMTEKDFTGLLSGGWDSRLITAFLSGNKRLHKTFTTELGVLKWGRYIAERRIAKEVAEFLGVKNRYIPSKAGKDIFTLSRMVDYSTSFHKWSLSIVEALPQDKNIIPIGYLGGVLLQNAHIPDILQKCVTEGNKEKAMQIILDEYISGGRNSIFSPIHYPDAESWKHVLNPQFISNSIIQLKR
ncbi:unnamed protein product, partial [marine sediment metagenome]